MKKIILSLAFLLTAALVAPSQVIYSVNWKSDAQIKVFVTNNKYDADLVVYKCKYKSDATGNRGWWHFTNYKSDAKKKIYFVDYKSDADLVIYVTENKYEAGWRNKTKEHLLY